MENPKCLSQQCDLTRCDLLWARLLVFVRFCDHTKGEGGLISEWVQSWELSQVILLMSRGLNWAVAGVSCDCCLVSLVGFCVF